MTEAERYDKAWATGNYEPLIGLLYTLCLYRTRYFDEYEKILDVGCGIGAAVKYHREIGGKESWGIDFAKSAIDTWKKCDTDKYCMVASAEAIPFRDNYFDMVTCTEMLEHIPEESVVNVLKEMFRVCKNDLFLTVALFQAKHKMPHDGSEPHICLKPAQWWVETVVDIGYRFTSMPYVGNFTLFMQARKSVPKKSLH